MYILDKHKEEILKELKKLYLQEKNGYLENITKLDLFNIVNDYDGISFYDIPDILRWYKSNRLVEITHSEVKINIALIRKLKLDNIN